MMDSIAVRRRKSDAAASPNSNNNNGIDRTMSWQHFDASSPTTTSTKVCRAASFDDAPPMLTYASPESSTPSPTSSETQSRAESSDISSNLVAALLMPEGKQHLFPPRQNDGATLTPHIPQVLLFPNHKDIRSTSSSSVELPCMYRPMTLSNAEDSTNSMYYSLSDEEDEASSFACLRKFSTNSLSCSDSSSDASSNSSRSSSGDSDSDSTLMSSSSSSRCSVISKSSSISSTSQIGSISNTSNSSAAWSHRRERMRKKKKALQLEALTKKHKSRDKFLKGLSRKTPSGPVYSKMYTKYMKENEARARIKNSSDNLPSEEGIVYRTRRHVLFELFHTVPAGLTQLLFCTTHVAIYEFFQMVVQDFLELNDYENQFLVYVCVFFVSVLMARGCGTLWEWTTDDTYENVRFDMHNKLILGDVDARMLRRFNSTPQMKHLFEVVSLYLCYLSANHFVTETMMKNLFDVRDGVIEDLPSMKFPDITTHIKNVLFYGEALFEDASLAAAEHVTAASSSACSVLGGDLCDERIFQACNTLDEFKANLTAADGEYLYDEVSFDTYYKIIGDTSAGVYYYESAMFALLCVTLAGAVALKRLGIGFWEH